MFRPHVIAVVIEQRVLGGHPPVRVVVRFNRPNGLEVYARTETAPSRSWSRLLGSPPQTSARTWGNSVSLVSCSPAVAVITIRPGVDRAGRKAPEAAVVIQNTCSRQGMLRKSARTHRREGPGPADGSRHGRRADWHDPGRAPRAVLRKPIGPDLRHRAADRFEARRILSHSPRFRSRP